MKNTRPFQVREMALLNGVDVSNGGQLTGRGYMCWKIVDLETKKCEVDVSSPLSTASVCSMCVL